MSKVVAFGEILMRLATERHLRFSQANFFDVTYGGGEFNVAVSLANYGVTSDFITCLPNNDIGQCAIEKIRQRNVGANHIVLDGKRIGIYFLETGAGTRGSKVIYDREDSAIANIKEGQINWDTALKDATHFHWSGVTPAISQNAAAECLRAVKTAHEKGIIISSDLNYRSKLWKYGKDPKDIMPELLKYSNIILGDIDTALFMLGKSKVTPNYEDLESLSKLYDIIVENCPNLDVMATTLRYSVSASHQKIGGILYDKSKILKAQTRDVTPVVDRVGSGDAFMGGLLYGLINPEFDLQKTLNFAVAACCLKHTISGDFNLTTKEEVLQMVDGNTSGKVSR
ncbi:sugar kinase [Tenacibaculum jejuense]|uniref:Putative 2-dehydro-3-deoxygluconokinase n=1 Tax=Tenacibaculum jejuense TaxID=584609 RepID=A0A238UAH5_9FLAO|nr:sugar kinase [Tenacibaculum jejuense]SNR16169.1 Putative 2-dehydro-3-deoxygluconokinase [Tenacibaculum jejuense]